MLQPSEAPIFYNLDIARQWVNLQSLVETFYLVKVVRYVHHQQGYSNKHCHYSNPRNTYEFWSADDLNENSDSKHNFEIIETWS